jgi:hypothetical protein
LQFYFILSAGERRILSKIGIQENENGHGIFSTSPADERKRIHGVKDTWKNWTRNLPLYVAFIVRHARGLLPPPKIRKGSKGLRNNRIFQRKKANAMDAGRTRDYLIAKNARCSLAQLNAASIFAVNVKSILATT